MLRPLPSESGPLRAVHLSRRGHLLSSHPPPPYPLRTPSARRYLRECSECTPFAKGLLGHVLMGFVFCRNKTQRRCDSFHSPIFDLLTSCAASCMAELQRNQESRSATCSAGPICFPFLCVISRISQPRLQGYLANKKIPFLDHHRAIGIDLLQGPMG